MDRTEKTIRLLTALCLLLAAGLGLTLLKDCCRKEDQQQGRERLVETDTVTYVDTVRHIAPAPKQTALTGRKEIAVATHVTTDDKEPRIRAETDTQDIVYAELNTDGDSVKITLPIVQKVYSDSEYTAYVSGYEPRLDSIFVYPRRDVVTTTIKKPPKRWHIGPTVGYGFTPQGFQPYIGISLTYSVISF